MNILCYPNNDHKCDVSNVQVKIIILPLSCIFIIFIAKNNDENIFHPLLGLLIIILPFIIIHNFEVFLHYLYGSFRFHI